MSKTANMLSAIEPWDLVANGHAETTMQMPAHYADEAIAASRLKAAPRPSCPQGYRLTRGWGWGSNNGK